MSVHESLTVGCPICGAVAGQPCKNYRGVNCAPHGKRIRAVSAPQFGVRWRAPRLRMLRERASRQQSLFDRLPDPDLS